MKRRDTFKLLLAAPFIGLAGLLTESKAKEQQANNLIPDNNKPQDLAGGLNVVEFNDGTIVDLNFKRWNTVYRIQLAEVMLEKGLISTPAEYYDIISPSEVDDV